MELHFNNAVVTFVILLQLCYTKITDNFSEGCNNDKDNVTVKHYAINIQKTMSQCFNILQVLRNVTSILENGERLR